MGEIWSANRFYYDDKVRGLGGGVYYDAMEILDETVSGNYGNLAHYPIAPGSLVLTDGTETFVDDGNGVLVSSSSGGDNGTITYSTGYWTVFYWAGTGRRYATYMALGTTVNVNWDGIFYPTIKCLSHYIPVADIEIFHETMGTLRCVTKFTGIEEYSKYVDLMQYVPEKFRSSTALQQLIYVLGLNVGSWIGDINDLQSIIDKYKVGDEYIQYLADLVGLSLLINPGTTIDQKRQQLIQVIDWYKMKGTYQALKVVGYTLNLNLNLYDMYTNDYVNFVPEPWYSGNAGGGMTNLISNPIFFYWSSGPASPPDDWNVVGTSAVIAQWSSESPVPKIGPYCAQFERNSHNCALYQSLTSYLSLQGTVVTFGGWVWSDQDTAVYLSISDSAGSTASSYHTGDGIWQYLTVSHLVDGSATYVNINCNIDNTNTTAYFAGTIALQGSSIVDPDTNPGGLDRTYYKSPHFGIEILLNQVEGQGALYVSGNNSYAEIPTSPDLSIATTGTYTVSAWIRPDLNDFRFTETSSVPGEGKFVALLGKGLYTPPIQMEWTFKMFNQTGSSIPNQISFNIFSLSGGTGVGAVFQDTVTIGQWIHVVGKVDATTVYIYKNGILRDSNVYTGLVTPQYGIAPLRIGTVTKDSYFQGGMDEIKIYNRDLSDGEIFDLYNRIPVASGLIASYTFDDFTPTIAYDSADNHNGTITNATYISDSSGILSYLFDGARTYNSLSNYVERVRPVNVVPQYSLLLNPITKQDGIVEETDGDIYAIALGGWEYNPIYYDDADSSGPINKYDDSKIYDLTQRNFLNDITIWRLGIGSKGVIPDLSFQVQVPMLTNYGGSVFAPVTVDIQNTYVEFIFTLPNNITLDNISELGLYSSDGATIRVGCTFPGISLVPGVSLKVIVHVDF